MINNNVIRPPNPLYNIDFLENKVNNTNQNLYDTIDSTNKNIFGSISRDTAEMILKKNYNSIQNSYWLVREKDYRSYVISLINNRSKFSHFKIDTIISRSVKYFIVNNKVRLYLPSNIDQIIRILSICPATSYLISGEFSPLLNGECIIPN